MSDFNAARINSAIQHLNALNKKPSPITTFADDLHEIVAGGFLSPAEQDFAARRMPVTYREPTEQERTDDELAAMALDLEVGYFFEFLPEMEVAMVPAFRKLVADALEPRDTDAHTALGRFVALQFKRYFEKAAELRAYEKSAA